MPFAFRDLTLRSYEIIISSSHAFSKCVKKRAGQLHICYCHTPSRVLWPPPSEGSASTFGLSRTLPVRIAAAFLRRVDRAAARQVDVFFANSRFTAARIEAAYSRSARVIYPPCDLQDVPLDLPKQDYYVCVSRLVPYKRVDLILEAFRRLNRRLVIVGDGPMRPLLERNRPPAVTFAGHLDRRKYLDTLGRARAIVHGALEDFGIALVESQACGTPVIAFRQGGSSETLIPWTTENPDGTGILFAEQSPDSVAEAVSRFESIGSGFRLSSLRRNAERFSRSRFVEEFRACVGSAISSWNGRTLP